MFRAVTVLIFKPKPKPQFYVKTDATETAVFRIRNMVSTFWFTLDDVYVTATMMQQYQHY